MFDWSHWIEMFDAIDSPIPDWMTATDGQIVDLFENQNFNLIIKHLSKQNPNFLSIIYKISLPYKTNR